MTLPTSGPLSLNNIQTEFGGSNPIGINEYYAGGSYVASGTSGTYGAVPSSGQISIQNFYGTSAYVPVYVENVFSTYIYTGNGTGANQTQSIVNNIDFTDFGGMLWLKDRTSSLSNILFDTVRGNTKGLISDQNATQQNYSGSTAIVNSFNNNGYTVISSTGYPYYNSSPDSYASWSFRKAPKFFDIVTYTGTNTPTNISHNLGSVPGCIIVKSTDTTGDWWIYHSGLNNGTSPQNYYIRLNSTSGQGANLGNWNNTAPTSTQFTVGSGNTNLSGSTYIAYLFGQGGTGGFGLTGTQDIISCGSFATDGTGNASVNLGWEPQWVLIKRIASGTTENWWLIDNLRGFSYINTPSLSPNTSGTESTIWASPTYAFFPTATGFQSTGNLTTSTNYIYIAIRRGPMQPPTIGTKVFFPYKANPNNTNITIPTGFVTDMELATQNSRAALSDTWLNDRLRGSNQNTTIFLASDYYGPESSTGAGMGFDSNVNYIDTLTGSQNIATSTTWWSFSRAPGFFDIVCYTGNGASERQVNHNLTTSPTFVIVKNRNNNGRWVVWVSGYQSGNTTYNGILNTNGAFGGNTAFSGNGSGTMNSTTFCVSNSAGANFGSNYNGYTYVAYLFGNVSGVSYSGTYTGNGGTQSIACGFGSSGARFILSKRADSSGDWNCWDSANGLTSGTSPYLGWNTTTAQTTGNNGTYASSGGFTLTSSSPVNVSGGTYVFLAIA